MFQATEGPASPENGWATLKSILPYIWPRNNIGFRMRVVLALMSLALAKVATVLVPFVYKAVVDGLDAGEGGLFLLAAPIFLVVAYGMARVLRSAFEQARDAIFTRVGQRAIRQLSLKTFQHVHNLSLRFHITRRTGGLGRVIERGTKGLDFLLRFLLFAIFPIILEIIMVCIIFFAAFGWSHALVTIGMVAFYVAFTYIVTERRMAYRRELNERDTEANTKAVDSMLNYETVKYFSNEEMEARRYDSAMAGYERAGVKISLSLAFLNFGQTVIMNIGLVAIMIMTALGVQNGSLTLGDFVMANAFLIQLFMPLNFLGTVFREVRQSLVDMEKMFDLLDVDPEVMDKPGAPELATGPGEVRFDNVSFAYEAERPILKDVSFAIPAGNTVAVVGPSGAGKSTLSRILFRFYEIQSGSVTMDGQNIADIRQDSLRRAIGIVPQDTVLFNDTIAYNVRYGRPTATEDEVREGARLAQIDKLIADLPDGYDTIVGERGLKLSGGEKQRVAIARTILKDPRILILDEATSALDTETEKGIQEALGAVSSGRTTLIIAHRLSTVIDADEILVLEAGRIAERGRHRELLDAGGRYAEMWRKQQEAVEASEKLRDADVAGLVAAE